jgi:DTW domain-containing protein YfiP
MKFVRQFWILPLLLLGSWTHHHPCLAFLQVLHSTQSTGASNSFFRLDTASSLPHYNNDDDTADDSDKYSEDFFLNQVETTVRNVLSNHNHDDGNDDILDLPGPQREAVGIARNLNRRLQNLRRNNDCPRCWMQRAHCICAHCPPVMTMMRALPTTAINRIFLILHHKEIGMKVDTAKLILAAFPHQCRLVVAGIGPEYQASMRELEESIQQQQNTTTATATAETNNHCLVLFPDDDALTFSEIMATQAPTNEQNTISWDVVVLDGTWAQARKMHSRYVPPHKDGGPRRVQLSQQAVDSLQDGSTGSGHQLRRHEIAWRQVGTFEATRLFLEDVIMTEESSVSSFKDEGLAMCQAIKAYQEIANEAAVRELGPPRDKPKAQ